MKLPIEGTTWRLRYVAEKRDASGVVNSGTNVKLKIHNITDDTWWNGSAWDTETELTGSHFSAGSWYYDLDIPSGDAGDYIEWVWYNETDGTVVEDGEVEILAVDNILTNTVSDIWAGGGSAYPVNITCQDENTDPVSGLSLVLWNTSEDVQASPVLITDGDGQVLGRGLPNGDYRVVGIANPRYDITPQNFTVNGATVNLTVSVSTWAPSTPPSGDYCTVYGFVEDPSGELLSGTTEIYKVNDPDYRGTGDDAVEIIYDQNPATIDENGRWEILLLRGANVDIRINANNGEKRLRENLTVPDAASVNWRDMVVEEV